MVYLWLSRVQRACFPAGVGTLIFGFFIVGVFGGVVPVFGAGLTGCHEGFGVCFTASITSPRML